MRDEESAYQRRSDNAESFMRLVSTSQHSLSRYGGLESRQTSKPEKRRPLFDELNCTSLCTNPLFQLH
jgi:hypothetical protein